MALTLPTSEDLQDYIEGQDDDQAIQQAMDLFVMATGLSATSSALEDRLIRSAVLEMAWAIQERHNEKEEEFSNASSERIGSYSYNRAIRAVSQGQRTGVGAFDVAVDYFLSQALSGDSSVSSEYVFTPSDYGHGFVSNYPDPSFEFVSPVDQPSSAPIFSVVYEDEIEVDEDGNLFIEK